MSGIDLSAALPNPGVNASNVDVLANDSAISGSQNSTVAAFHNLVPALVECFAIILLGYVAGRSGVVCPSQSRGLGHYVTYFALPAMLFKSLVILDFSEVNWLFWSSVLIGKAIVFVVVYVGTLLVSGWAGLGKAGLFGIFATQSNDFALGYPIVKALYENSYPQIMQYIYILAPVNLMFINPWGFLSLEANKSASNEHRRHKAYIAWVIMKGLLTNPIFITVPIGIVFNFALSQRLPVFLEGILTTLESSFGATALFLLGINMVGKVRQQSGMALLPPALLIASKRLLLPLVVNQLVYVIDPGRGNETLTETYASFGFLYGSLPTAPTVFLYATHYQESLQMIAPTMVYCTFVSAPFMFITATMVMIPMATENQYHDALDDGAFNVSCIGLASAVWVFIIFLLRKKLSHLPHQFTANLIIAQAVGALSVIICHSVHITAYWGRVVHFIFLMVGIFGCRCWTSMVALALFLLRYRSTCFVVRNRFFFYIYGWGAPLIITGILVTVIPLHHDDVDVLYEIEKPQLIASVVVLSLNVVLTVAFLFALQRRDRFRQEEYQSIPGYDSANSEPEGHTSVSLEKKKHNLLGEGNNPSPHLMPPPPIDSLRSGDFGEGSSTSLDSPSSSSPLTDIEDLPNLNVAIRRQMCPARFNCSHYRSNECRRMLLHRNLQEISQQEEEDVVALDEAKNHQLGRHLVLLYLMVLSMIVAVSLCLWKLLGSTQSGIFLELSFLDCILNFGQGFFALAVFGFDTENVIMPVVRMFRRVIYGTEKVRLPRRNDLSPEVMMTCEQFKTHHMARCQDAIVTDLKYHLRTYRNVFRGSDLVDWLLEVGLAEGRSEATAYGTRLLLGQLLEHTHQEHHFHDSGLFYRFLLDEEEEGGACGGSSKRDVIMEKDEEEEEEEESPAGVNSQS
ncbi:lysosomal cholesterol signaling protein-like [Diadema antillarum]|uniref:lysosomal cholesterol signaling protein-like n=1 Tax=Diadema antillarum TaxID=105358 RepID=UPI003A8ABF36